PFVAEIMAQDGDKPCAHVGARRERLDLVDRMQQRLLDEVVRPVGAVTQREREAAELGDGRKHGLLHGWVERHGGAPRYAIACAHGLRGSSCLILDRAAAAIALWGNAGARDDSKRRRLAQDVRRMPKSARSFATRDTCP